jgi:DNA-directed RNA polymerase subunit N (RpoN/RPB10)
MIIPVKCFTCGNVLADKYEYYLREVRAIKVKEGLPLDEVIYFSKTNVVKTPEARVLNNIGLTKICCRRHVLSHVDI